MLPQRRPLAAGQIGGLRLPERSRSEAISRNRKGLNGVECGSVIALGRVGVVETTQNGKANANEAASSIRSSLEVN